MSIDRRLLACILLAGCGNEGDPARDDSLRDTGAARSAVEAPVLATVPTSLRIARVKGTDTTEIGGDWSSAAEASVWTAFAIGGRVVRMQEASRDTLNAPFIRQYHFDGSERLSHYVEDRSQLVSEGNASPRLMRVHTEAQWPATGPAVTARRVDGAARPVQPWDIENTQRHADQLLSLARPGVPRP